MIYYVSIWTCFFSDLYTIFRIYHQWYSVSWRLLYIYLICIFIAIVILVEIIRYVYAVSSSTVWYKNLFAVNVASPLRKKNNFFKPDAWWKHFSRIYRANGMHHRDLDLHHIHLRFFSLFFLSITKPMELHSKSVIRHDLFTTFEAYQRSFHNRQAHLYE